MATPPFPDFKPLTEAQRRYRMRLSVHGELYVPKHTAGRRTAEALVSRGVAVWDEEDPDVLLPAD